MDANALDVLSSENQDAKQDTDNQSDNAGNKTCTLPEIDDGNTPDDTDQAIDFSYLPETVWVRIMTSLSLHEKYNIAQTCNTLYNVFHHPSLWNTVCIHLLGSELRKNQDVVKYDMAETYAKMIEYFGAYFQNLTIIFIGYFGGMTRVSREVISKLSERCRLESLTLHVGIIRTKADLSKMRPMNQLIQDDIKTLALLVGNAFRLKTFILKSWPYFPGEPCINVLDALRSNQRIRNLENLSLFFEQVHETNWTTQNPVLPKPGEVILTIRTFKQLKTLSLRLCMINQEVIEEISKPDRRIKLEKLQVLVTWSRHNKDLQIPEIDHGAWRKVRQTCPNLRVEFTFLTRMPWNEKSSIFKPDVPVSALYFNEFSNLSVEDLHTIVNRYSSKLVKFISYTYDTDTDMDGAVLHLIDQCSRITTFAYHGPLLGTTILELAKYRGQKWEMFEMKERQIKLDFFDEKDEEVVGHRENGELYLKGMLRKPHEDDSRETRLQELYKKVSEIIGKKWCALPHIVEEVPERLPNL